MIIKGQVKEVMMRDMGVAGLHKDSEFIVTMEVLGTETELQFPVERDTVGNYDLDTVVDLDIDVQRVVRLDGPGRYKVADDTADRIPFENIDDGNDLDKSAEVETYDDEEVETYDDEETQEQQENSEGSGQAEEQQQGEKQNGQADKKPDFLEKMMNKETEEKAKESDQSNNKPEADSSVDEVVNDDTGEMSDEEIAQKMGRKEKTETEHVEAPKVINPTDNLTESDYSNEGESASGGMVAINTQEGTQDNTQKNAQFQSSSETETDEQNSRSQNNSDVSGSNAGLFNGLNMMGGYSGNEEADDEEDYADEE